MSTTDDHREVAATMSDAGRLAELLQAIQRVTLPHLHAEIEKRPLIGLIKPGKASQS